MSRRHHAEATEFGSDSFLDIIANIVGILIILIVLAGLKVSRMPAPSASRSETSVEQAEVTSRAEPKQVKTQDDAKTDPFAAEDVSFPTEALDPPVELWTASLRRELTERQEQLDAITSANQKRQEERSTLTDQIDRSFAEATERTERLRRIRAEVAELSSQVHAQEAKLASALSQQDQRQQEVEILRRDLQQRRKRLAEAVSERQVLIEVLNATPAPAPEDSLVHRISPVGQKATGEELFFRVAGGRVTWIPLKDLLEELKAQMKRRASTVVRFGTMQGSVGPIGGFRMDFTMQRSGGSVLQNLQYGAATRIGLAGWTLVPVESAFAETIEQAAQPGSRFRRVIESAELNSVATLWVYDDSFESYEPLRDLVHRAGLKVAARPLPSGVPISASPSGSASTAQ